MPRPAYTTDALALTIAWGRAYPGLCGQGNPLPQGMHMQKRRGGQKGASCVVELIAPREVDFEGGGDSARVTFKLASIGSEDGARLAVNKAALAVANACQSMTGAPQLVTLRAGTADETSATLAVVHTVYGPLLTGDDGGEITMNVDATFVWQIRA